MRIYLIGYMGSGKSTLGHKLALELGLSFIDLDRFIEERNCKTVPQIFKEFGEEVFRQRERKALEEVSDFENVVVATGGGAPCFFDNIDLMNQTGITIFLNPDTDVLVERLWNSQTERPLIKGKSKEELIELIKEMQQKRLPFYSRAEIQISGSEDILNEVVIKIKEKVKKSKKKR